MTLLSQRPAGALTPFWRLPGPLLLTILCAASFGTRAVPRGEVRLTLHDGEILVIADLGVSRVCENLWRPSPRADQPSGRLVAHAAGELTRAAQHGALLLSGQFGSPTGVEVDLAVERTEHVVSDEVMLLAVLRRGHNPL
jgi:hypothetical protein